MRQIHWKKTLLFGAALLLVVLTVFSIHHSVNNTITEPSPPTDSHDTDSTRDDCAPEEVNEGEEAPETSFQEEIHSELIRFDTSGGVVIVSWKPDRLAEDDSIEITIVGAELQKGIVLTAERSMYVFGDGKEGESYSITARIRHSDGSPGEEAAKTIVLQQDTSDQHDLPVIWVETEAKQNPGYLLLETPEGMLGESITQNAYVKGVCRIINLNSAKEVSSTAKIRVRGNTSAVSGGRAGKKPYKLVLDTPVDLFENGRAEKRFVLLASGTNLKSFLGFTMAQILEMDWAQNCRFVNVVLNGDWKGLYLITEAIDAEIRDDHIARDGMLMEYDAYWWKEDFCFRTELSSKMMAFTVKYPEIEPDSEEAIQLQEYVEKVEDSILERSEFEYLDIESFAKWITVRDLLGHGDPSGSNMFYYLRHWNTEDPAAEKLFMGPLWDFDAAFTYEDEWSDQHKYPSWFYWLFQDACFREEYVNNWKSFEPILYPALSSRMRELCEAYGRSVNLARFLDDVRWGSGSGFYPVEEEAEQRLDWLKNRIDWMNEAAERMDDEMFGEGNMSVDVSADCTSLEAVLLDNDYSQVWFAIWSEENGQEDLHWYRAKKNNEGNWSCTVDLYNHRSAGVYIIHAYEGTSNNRSFLYDSRFYVKQALVPEEQIVWDHIDSPHIQLRLISDKPHEQVEYAVWSEENGQDDLAWYKAELNPDGVWSYTLNLDKHTRNGLLYVYAYEAGGGNSLFLDYVSIYLSP